MRTLRTFVTSTLSVVAPRVNLSTSPIYSLVGGSSGSHDDELGGSGGRATPASSRRTGWMGVAMALALGLLCTLNLLHVARQEQADLRKAHDALQLAALTPPPPPRSLAITCPPQVTGIPLIDRSKLKPLVQVPRPANSTFKYELSIGSFFAQSDKAMVEWIEYHRMLGVEHFFLYEHELEPVKTSRPSLKHYIDAGILELEAVAVPLGPAWRWKQGEIFRTLLQQGRDVTRWLMLIDPDEFVVPKFTDSIPEMLLPFEEHAGLTVNWQMFGTSRISRLAPTDMLLERMQFRSLSGYHENEHVKSIVQPHRVSTCYIHHCDPVAPWKVVDSSGAPSGASKRIPPLIDHVQLNHYSTRDEQHFRRTQALLPEHDKLEFLKERLNLLMQVQDTSVQRFVPALRERLFQGIDRIKGAAAKLLPYSDADLELLTAPL